MIKMIDQILRISISNQVKPAPGPGIALNTKIIMAVPIMVNFFFF